MCASPDFNRQWSLGILILRIYIGAAVLIAHGLPKLQEMLGENPFFPVAVAELGFPFPTLFAWLVVIIQVGLSLFLILGVLSRFSAFFNGFVIAFGVLSVHWVDGFERMEAGLLYAVALAVIVITGSGSMSVERVMRNRKLLSSTVQSRSPLVDSAS